MDLAEKMVKYRAANRISQRELAERCGISLQTVNTIECGKQTPSRVTEAKILIVIDGKEEENGAINQQDKVL